MTLCLCLCVSVSVALSVCLSLKIIYKPYIKTHSSESQGQEEACCTRRTSKLFTCNTAMKFVNTLNKPPFKAIA